MTVGQAREFITSTALYVLHLHATQCYMGHLTCSYTNGTSTNPPNLTLCAQSVHTVHDKVSVGHFIMQWMADAMELAE